MHRFRGLVVIGAFAVVVSVVAAGPAAAAKGGNNDTAKACQKGGWKTLVPRDAAGGSFANQGDCVNDGAQGIPPFGTTGSTACGDIGGIFQLRPTVGSWNCQYAVPPNPPRPSGLPAACATDTGGQGKFETLQSNEPSVLIRVCTI